MIITMTQMMKLRLWIQAIRESAPPRLSKASRPVPALALANLGSWKKPNLCDHFANSA